MARHPYQELDDLHFWSRVVTPVAFHSLDPVRTAKFHVGPDDKVATMGSCFAQHLSRFLSRSGLNYFVTEGGDEALGEEERALRNYGTFSARYGNVYTVRQAVQLVERVYSRRWRRREEVWRRGDRYVDSLRPQVEPAGFPSEEELRADRAAHLLAVRRVFEESDVLVFTLGLTEGWRSRHSGLVFPVVPGASGGEYRAADYEFVNFGAAEVTADLHRFVRELRKVNPQLKVLLTVSPVPLIATYTDQHVLPATVYSKAVLRVAAAEVSAAYGHVDYFPSYEIVTSTSSGGRYFADDLRSITDEGVSHVMRVFKRHYLDGEGGATSSPAAQSLRREIAAVREIICDEEVLDAEPPNSASAAALGELAADAER
ncbi:MAG TPA: GSCFA domain-containing protein [Acidimicrobiales bacterium]|nr:GSCFA domain-containing protein [Acidimicrobiales bacterium]